MVSKKKVLENSYLALDLEPEEEEKLKIILKQKDIFGKQLLRSLVRKYIKEYETQKENEKQQKGS